MDYMEKAISLMPPELENKLRSMEAKGIEEIRIRIARRPTVVIAGEEYAFSSNVICRENISRIIEKATGASYHMAEQGLTEGFINYRGLRIGVCGQVNMQKNNLHSMGRIDSLAIRIPAEHKGISNKLFNGIYSNNFESTLIVSQPGGGKTSLLREMCRVLSNKGRRVGIVDERYELMADIGDGGFDLGEHSDVISGVPKALGSIMLLRSMNPEIIAMDEITKGQDVEALAEIAGCGVKLLATAHALNVVDLMKRPLYKQMLELGVFEYALVISGKGSKRVYVAERLAI